MKGMDMDRDVLLKQVTVLGFMALDLHLYLNTHPHDKEALTMYNDVIANERKARLHYEEVCGPLSFGNEAAHEWSWPRCPWPWQESFNYHTGTTETDWHKPYGEELLKPKIRRKYIYAGG
jgi:spore coat protein JB